MKQLIVPIAVVSILASMILPVPTVVMDFLLIANLLLALVLLISTLYVSDPLKLSALPTILLLATLYRLALNISSTRLILSKGDAGETIEAFGSIVIQGNLVVGLVIFLIITLIQFIVIAKGSERVAEVSARFTLDAMPGKQMSIDADVRAGLIDFQTARKKRQELQTESRFYGALDGAMKFVKGDAVAGIIVCIINLVGGLLIGVISEGLELKSAIAKYSLLTVGDGLVSQIPALLNSLAAGLVVTRVAKGDGASLSSDILNQLGQIRAVKIMIGSLALIGAVLPGVPILPCGILGFALLISSFKHNKELHSDGGQTIQVESSFKPRIPSLLQLEISRELAMVLSKSSNLSDQVDTLRQRIYEARGLILARPELSPIKEEGLICRILMRGIPVTEKRWEKIEDFSNDTVQKIVDDILNSISAVVEKRAPECIDDILTRRTLDFFDKEAPELVSTVVPNIATVTQLTFILKSLACEGISLRSFDLILQAVAEAGRKGADERVMLEEVRIALARVITRYVAGPSQVIRAYSIDPIIDLTFTRAEKAEAALDIHCIEAVTNAMSLSNQDNKVIITSRSARKLLRECLLARGIKITVLAHEEIDSDIDIEWISIIQLEDQEHSGKIIEQLAA